jgi:uncharacterized RDD family membrane protein YckC
VSLVDVDAYDETEEQFASSVMADVALKDEEQELASGTLASARKRYGGIGSEPQIDPPLPTRSLGTETLPNPFDTQDEWRNEVASRLQSYKARRRRSLGDSTMSFNFESTAGNHVFLKPDHDTLATAYAEPEPAPNYYAPHACAAEPVFEEIPTPVIDQPTSDAQTTLEGFAEPGPQLQAEQKINPILEKAKLIFFPKPPLANELRTDELADPVFDTPRILDATEELESVAIPLADITLNPQEEDPCPSYTEPMMEFHVTVAPVPQRVFAEVLDTLLVLLASGIFGTIVAKLSPAWLTLEKHALLGILLLVPAIFWSVYKYMFLVHGGVTPGMQMAQLRLVHFDGHMPSRVPRRYRALSMLVSIFPLGLGLLWSFVDPDTLCWHDRISRTYMTAR